MSASTEWHFPPEARALGWPIAPPKDGPVVALPARVVDGFCDACGCGDPQGCDECIAECEPERAPSPCAVCGCRWCGPEVLA